jgi:hypothetical protein
MQYWQKNGYPQASNGTTLDGTPASASNVGDPPAGGGPPPPNTAFPFNNMCVENPSPSWNESHVDSTSTTRFPRSTWETDSPRQPGMKARSMT